MNISLASSVLPRREMQQRLGTAIFGERVSAEISRKAFYDRIERYGLRMWGCVKTLAANPLFVKPRLLLRVRASTNQPEYDIIATIRIEHLLRENKIIEKLTGAR
jgi:hypothetical protein